MGSIQRERQPSMQREDQTDHGNGPRTNSSESAVNHLSKSVVRESRTPRSVGTGGGRPLPVTRSGWQRCRSATRHRALVEGPEVTRPERPPVRDLGRDRRGRRTRNRLLEQPQAPLHLGPPQTPSSTPPSRCGCPPSNLTDLADAPLRRPCPQFFSGDEPSPPPGFDHWQKESNPERKMMSATPATSGGAAAAMAVPARADETAMYTIAAPPAEMPVLAG